METCVNVPTAILRRLKPSIKPQQASSSATPQQESDIKINGHPSWQVTNALGMFVEIHISNHKPKGA
jgi:hypothetical protein